MYILNTESIFRSLSLSHFICTYQFLQKGSLILTPKEFFVWPSEVNDESIRLLAESTLQEFGGPFLLQQSCSHTSDCTVQPKLLRKLSAGAYGHC